MSFTVSDLQREFKQWGNEALGLITENMTMELRKNTRKKTEWASTNWIPQSNKYFRGLNGTKDSVSKAGQRAAIAQVRKDLKAGIVKTIHVTNNVPYILSLEYGGPRNVGDHFIDPSIQSAILKTEREMKSRFKSRGIKIEKNINL